ncbi:MAG: DoxX family protein [Maribacter sp.]
MNIMYYVIIAAKIIIFISIINVWFFRFNKKTPYRGGEASSMKAEFASYGLSETMVYIVGALKVLSALCILLSIWVPQLAIPAASVMAILMIGAIIMHLKIKDSLMKSLPAFIFLVLSLFIVSYA